MSVWRLRVLEGKWQISALGIMGIIQTLWTVMRFCMDVKQSPFRRRVSNTRLHEYVLTKNAKKPKFYTSATPSSPSSPRQVQWNYLPASIVNITSYFTLQHHETDTLGRSSLTIEIASTSSRLPRPVFLLHRSDLQSSKLINRSSDPSLQRRNHSLLKISTADFMKSQTVKPLYQANSLTFCSNNPLHFPTECASVKCALPYTPSQLAIAIALDQRWS